jgi:hypothetical protein
MYNIYIQHPGANGPASEATVLVRRGQGRGRGRDERRAERSPAAVREKVLRGRARHTRPRPERRSLHARGPQEVGGAHTAGPASGSGRSRSRLRTVCTVAFTAPCGTSARRRACAST